MINQMTAAARRGLSPERPADDPNVGFQERQPYFAQRSINVRGRQHAFAAQILECPF